MSENDPAPTTVAEQMEEAEACIRLMREYTDKIVCWRKEAEALDRHLERGHPDGDDIENWDEMKGRYLRIREACSDLSSTVSGLIEQSRLPSVTRTELRLRLGEFETAFLRYQSVFPDRYDLVFERLTNPAKKDEVIRTIRDLAGVSLGDARSAVDTAPKPVKKAIPKRQAEVLKKQLEAAGVKVTLRAV